MKINVECMFEKKKSRMQAMQQILKQVGSIPKDLNLFF